MSNITLGAAIIVGKNRLEQLKRLLPQLTEFEQIVVVNTSGQGAVNNYVKKLGKKYECYDYEWRPTPYKRSVRTIIAPVGTAGEKDPLDQYGEIGWKDDVAHEMYGLNDWGFAGARNESFSHLKTTHALWLDTDDLIGVKFEGKDVPLPPKAAADAFRKIASEAPDVDVWFADYIYSRDEHGNPNVVHARERLVRLECGWKWVYPIHECLVPGRQPKHSIIKDVQVIHYPEATEEKSADRNMRMLLDWLKQLEAVDQRHDLARCRLQIGETFWGQERYADAAKWLEFEFLAKHQDALDLEKWQGACFACKSYMHVGNLAGAERMALKAIGYEPGLQDGYLLLGETKFLAEADPQDVLELIDTGGRKDDPPPQVIRNPLDYTFTPFCITSQCKFQMNDYEAALDFALKALRICPNDVRAEKLRLQAAEKLRAQEGTQAAKAIYQLLRDFGEHEKAAQLFNLLPYPVQKMDEIHKVAEGAQARIGHIIDPDEFVKFYSDPNDWEPVPFNFFAENKIPGRDRYTYLLKRLKQRPDVKKVLYVGAEDGFHAILLAQEGYEVVGLELNAEAVRIANERAQRLGVNATFVEGWIEQIKPDEVGWEEAFDAVVASEQIDKTRDVSFFLDSLGDCLRPGGVLLITTPDGAWDDGDHPHNYKEGKYPKAVRAFTQDSLESLLLSNELYHLTECHFLPYAAAYREGQGWQVAEIVKGPRPNGPRVRIFCGELVEAFSPMNLESGGIGGSETAVIYMAGYWAKMGCQVVVYGNNVGIYDGVLYRYADEFSMDFKSDIFISWRLPHLYGKGRPNADVTVLWCHDLYYPIEIQKSWMDNVDVIAVLSQFHKDYITKVHPFTEEKIWVTRNGIDPARYRQLQHATRQKLMELGVPVHV